MPEYLTVDSRKISYREYWNIARSPMVVVPWVAKLLKIPMQFGSPMPWPTSQRAMEIAEEQLAPAARIALRQKLDQSLAIGFHSPRYFFNQTMRGETRTSFIGLLHSSGRVSARLFCTVSGNPVLTITKVLVAFLSELSDGTYFVSGEQREMFKVPPWVMVNRKVGGTPGDLLKGHERALSEFELRNPAKRVQNGAMLDDLWDRYEKRLNDFGIERGIYVPVTIESVSPVPVASRVPPVILR